MWGKEVGEGAISRELTRHGETTTTTRALHKGRSNEATKQRGAEVKGPKQQKDVDREGARTRGYLVN